MHLGMKMTTYNAIRCHFKTENHMHLYGTKAPKLYKIILGFGRSFAIQL